MEEHMDREVATVWVRIGSSRRNSLVIGGIYREHHQLGRGELNDTWMETQQTQEWSWKRIMRKWSNAGQNSNCVVICR